MVYILNRVFDEENLLFLFGHIAPLPGQTQLSPTITSWLQNTTETDSCYVAGNETDAVSGNRQTMSNWI